MALWHFIKSDLDIEGGVLGVSWTEDGQDVSSFDDGLTFNPDEDGFSRTAADAKAATLGSGVTAVYTGTPNRPARLAAEEQKAAADAEIESLINPPSPPSEADQINAKFDALLAAAPDRADDISKLRTEALDAIN